MGRQTYTWNNKTLSREELARVLHQVGFRGDRIAKMIAIAGRESGYRAGVHGSDAPKERVSGDRGLFQINYVHDSALKKAGIIKRSEDLFDPVTNAKAAFWLSQGGKQLSPWAAASGGFTGGGDPFYGTDLGAARQALSRVRQQGWGAQAGGRGGRGGGPDLTAVARRLGNQGDPRYRKFATLPMRQVKARRRAVLDRLGVEWNGAGQRMPKDPKYFNWSQHPELNDNYETVSPHLNNFEKWVMKNYGGSSLGDYNERAVRGGTAPSVHGYGAAWDWDPRSMEEARQLNRKIIANPGAFGIQSIHDYDKSRIWHVGREGGGDLGGGWQSQARGSGGGQMGSAQHFHYEVTPQTWKAPQGDYRMMTQGNNGGAAGGATAPSSQRWARTARSLNKAGDPAFGGDMAGRSQQRRKQAATAGVVDPSLYTAARRGIRGDYLAQASLNEYNRNVAARKGDRSITDYTREWGKNVPRYTASWAKRGMSGPGVQSGVYKRAFSDYLGDYTRNQGRLQQDYDQGMQQFDLRDSELLAAKNRALADLEMRKAREITNTAAGLRSLSKQYGG